MRRRDADNEPSDNALKRKRDADNKAQDPNLQEYLSLMQNSSKTRTWANDDNMANASEEPAPVLDQTSLENSATDQLPSLPKKARTHDTFVSGSTEQPRPMLVDQSEQAEEDEATAQEETEPAEEASPVSDADWLRSKTSRLLGLLDEDEQADFEERKSEEPPESPSQDNDASRTTVIGNTETRDATDNVEQAEQTPEQDQNMDLIRASARLFVRNLAYDTKEADLEPLFASFGKIEEVSFSPFPRLSLQTRRRFALCNFRPSARMMNFLIGTSDAKQMMLPVQEILVDASCISEERFNILSYATIATHI